MPFDKIGKMAALAREYGNDGTTISRSLCLNPERRYSDGRVNATVAATAR